MERRIGSWSCNTATGEIAWSQEVYEIFGASRQTDPSLGAFFDSVHPREHAGLQRQLREAVRNGRSCCLVYRIDLPGGPRTVELTGSSLAHEYAGAVIEHPEAELGTEVEEIGEIVGGCAPWLRVLACVTRVAATDSTVLITGETGTGKELIARAIHKGSPRAACAFVSVNCAALSPALISSELFGHEKGSFTGAIERRLGRFELADGGTIFLDEVGDLPPDTQVALLRVLQEREFERLGGSRTLRVDVRVIAATNRDLENGAAAGRFRSDLYYRLNVFPIEAPPLRDRKEDIPLLLQYFVKRYARKAGKNIRRIDSETLKRAQDYDWPGNVRELQNVVERSVILCQSGTLSVDDAWLSRKPNRRHLERAATAGVEAEATGERAIIEAALAVSRGRVAGPAGAAARLNIPPSTLESRIKALQIRKLRFKFPHQT